MSLRRDMLKAKRSVDGLPPRPPSQSPPRQSPSPYLPNRRGSSIGSVCSNSNSSVSNCTRNVSYASKNSTSEEAVRVAVRVRPPLRNEVREDMVVSMDPSQQVVFVRDNTVTSKEALREFRADAAVWSSPGEALDGSAPISQAELYAQLGRPLLLHALDGFNSTLMAYGQTGSGKTFTMMGDLGKNGKSNKNNNDDSSSSRSSVFGEVAKASDGIVPRFCRELFEQIEERSFVAPSGGTIGWDVHLRYVEVYCERISDLLNNNAPVTMREEVVENEMRFSLFGARRVRVSSADEMLRHIRTGNHCRTTAATAQNERSSRSHAVIMIELAEVVSFPCATGGVVTAASKTLTVRLVDLAGSERVGEAGVTGQQFREGVDINLSLFTLGVVIESLADPRRRGIRPPYRESTLTRLLRDAFGGNSKTTMVCTVAPTAAQRQQTLQTLHYATKARCVVNRPRADADPSAVALRRANAELAHLRCALDARGSSHMDTASALACLVSAEARCRGVLAAARVGEFHLLRALCASEGAAVRAAEGLVAETARLEARLAAAAAAEGRREAEWAAKDAQVREYFLELEAADARREASHRRREAALAAEQEALAAEAKRLEERAAEAQAAEAARLEERAAEAAQVRQYFLALEEEDARRVRLSLDGEETLRVAERRLEDVRQREAALAALARRMEEEAVQREAEAQRLEEGVRRQCEETESRLQKRSADLARRQHEASVMAEDRERTLLGQEADLAELVERNKEMERRIAQRDAEVAQQRMYYVDLRKLLEDRERLLLREHAHRMEGKESAYHLTDDLLDVNELLKKQLNVWIQKYQILKSDEKIECERCSWHNNRDAKVCRCCGNSQLV